VVSPLSSLIFTAISGLAGLITFGMAHPKEQYYDQIPDVKENRIADVVNALAPIVSDVHEFMESGDNGSPEELTEVEMASVALADSLSPSDDLPDLKESVGDYYEPQKFYKRCRKLHDACYAAFVSGVILGLIPALISLELVVSGVPGYIGAVSYWLAALATLSGVLFFFTYLYYRNKLDSMTESADFQL